MEDALELAEFLPLSFKTESEQDYISFLWDAFESNHTNEKYQFAFLAYHMLTMSFIYFIIWRIRLARPDEFAHGLIGFGNDESCLLGATSPFVFSSVRERSILRFLRLISCDNQKIGTYAKLVDDRNDTAHPNGNIFYRTEPALQVKIKETLRVVQEIQNHSRSMIQELYSQFLAHSANPEEREYPEEDDQIREILIHGHYLSRKDLEICLAFDSATLAGSAHYEDIQRLHSRLTKVYGADLAA